MWGVILTNTVKNYLKGLLYFFIPFFTLILLISILYYFDILNNQVIKYFKIITLLVSSLVSGFYIGRKSISKGYLNGLKLSGGIAILFLIINLIMGDFKWYHLVYYLIMIVVTSIGSMLGINQKK